MRNSVQTGSRRFFPLLICIAFLCAAACMPVRAEVAAVSDYDVTRFSDNNGIPTGEANAVLQTQEGFLWFGGYGGLQRYDGVSFEQFSGKNGLTSYSIRSLWESPEGIMWVGSNEQGAFYYDGKNFRRPEAEESGKHLSVRCFAADDQGRIWLGTADGLAYVENGRLTVFDMEASGYRNSTVYTLSKDRDGLLWAVDYAGALVAVDTAAMEIRTVLSPGTNWSEGVYAYSALAAEDGSLYAGTSTNVILHVKNAVSDPVCEEIDSGSVTSVNSIYETETGEFWFGGDYGIGMIDASGTYFDCSYLEHASHIVCMTGDYEKNLWAASSKYGVLHIRRVKTARLTQAPELADTETYTICRSGERYYVGTEKGLLVFDRDWYPIDLPLEETLAGIHIHQILEGSDGKLYLGTYYNGVYVYDAGTEETETIEVGGSRCRALYNLSDGRLAVATNKGVDLLKNGAVEESIPTGIMVLCLLETEDGILLGGTDGDGILEFSSGEAKPFGNQQGLSGGVILRMRKDAAEPGKLWVSCGNDLFYGDENGFAPAAALTKGSGSILDIFPAGGKVWLFRSSGILCCAKAELLDPEGTLPSADYCSRYDGIPGPVTANSWSLFEDGKFAVCTVNGIGILNSELYRYDTVPKSSIKAVTLSDGSLWDGGSELNLGKDLAKISLSLAALTYVGENTGIEYWLEGLDKEPIVRDIRDLHEVEYTNLAAGEYLFRFNVINCDGVRGEEKILKLVKAPKFTETFWFPLLIFAAAAVIFTLIGLLRLRRVREKQEEYRQITEQTIATISGAIDAKDPYTEGHSRRVAEFAVRIAERLGMKQEELERLHYVALLHDIGKIGVPDDILKKPGRLTDEEFEAIKQHTLAGGDILKNFNVLPGVAEGAEYHHERFDGSGYCHHLKGEEIPLFARIISVADAFDAMNSSRCYRKALDTSIIISEIEKGKGKQFDPALADVALEIIREDEKKEMTKENEKKRGEES